MDAPLLPCEPTSCLDSPSSVFQHLQAGTPESPHMFLRQTMVRRISGNTAVCVGAQPSGSVQMPHWLVVPVSQCCPSLCPHQRLWYQSLHFWAQWQPWISGSGWDPRGYLGLFSLCLQTGIQRGRGLPQSHTASWGGVTRSDSHPWLFLLCPDISLVWANASPPPFLLFSEFFSLFLR